MDVIDALRCVAVRSIINVMQERQDAQDRDMAILKDDIAQLRHQLTAERDVVHSLRAHAADAAWAIADVKRAHDQVCTSPLTVCMRIAQVA